jgi:DNA-binding NtrC family response regulator
VLIVEDDVNVMHVLTRHLERRGFVVTGAQSGAEARSCVESAEFDAVILDYSLGDIRGVDLLAEIRALDPTITAVIVSGAIDVPETVRALRSGAEDVQVKPVEFALLEASLERGLARTELQRSGRLLDAQVQDPYGVLDDSPAMQRTIRLVTQSAPGQVPLLFIGEAGTGRRALAELAHRLSARATRPFITVALGGADDGACRLAIEHALTLLREAGGESRAMGTLLLDDVRRIGPDTATRLLALLDARFAAAHGYEPTDVRLMSVAQRDPRQLLDGAGDAANVLHRLSLITIAVPALRERGSAAVLTLAQRILARLRIEAGEGPASFTASAKAWLGSVAWPHNVPQLRRVLEDAFVEAMGHTSIDDVHLAPPLTAAGLHAAAPATDANEWSLAAAERRHIRTVLSMTGDHRTRAAQLLGITRTTLYKKLAEYELLDANTDERER